MFSPSKMRSGCSWPPSRVVVALFFATAVLVCAQSLSYLRDLNQLKEQHEQAKAAALKPLERRYQASLEQLLKRATAGKRFGYGHQNQAGAGQISLANDPRNTPLELIGAWEIADPLTNLRLPRKFKLNGKTISETPPGWANGRLVGESDPQL